MHLHAGPSEAAEVRVAAFSPAQLEQLARSVEARRLQLEDDINAYIARKQAELRQHETDLLETLRAMPRDGDAASSPAAERLDDRAQPHKQKKHGRVHKRERELYGLVTPVFLPLLDARDSTPPEKKPAAKHADTSKPLCPAPRDTPETLDTDTAADMAAEPLKKRRSSIKKKSALRHTPPHTPQRIRKRVSLVIDDQVVLPSDTILEPPEPASDTSPTTSPTASTASLDDMIDPRLTCDGPIYTEHHDAVHHSLPLTTTQPKTSPTKTYSTKSPTNTSPTNTLPTKSLTSTSPTKSPTNTSPTKSPTKSSPTKSAPPPFSSPAPVLEAAHSTPKSPAVPYAPPSYATRSFLDPPPEQMHIEDTPSTQFASTQAHPADQGFQTYVGGISGSGVDDVNQVGSVGYPSSLGASYLESYMQGRPLSVRMAAAEREGDTAEIRKLRGLEERRKKRETDEKLRQGDDDEWSVPIKGKDVDEDDFMGSMDGF